MGKIISFIVPALNEEDRIGRCLDSILSQKNKNIEIIAVNDGSNDNTLNILLDYQSKYDNVICLNNEKTEGLSFSRNRALEMAQGRYVWFVDGDDYIRSDSIDILQNAIEKEVDLELIYFDLLFRKGDTIQEAYLTDETTQQYLGKGTEVFCLLSKDKNMRASACCGIYSRSFLKRNNIQFVEGVMGEDACFSMKAMLLAKQVMYLREALYIYHRSQDSITTTTSDVKFFEGTFVAYCDMKEFYESNEWSEDVGWAIVNYIGEYYRIAREKYNERDALEIQQFIKSLKYSYFIQFQLFFGIEADYKGEKISNAVWRQIEKEKRIIVYGAGRMSRYFLYQLMMKKNIIVEQIVVSEYLVDTPIALYGHEVLEIDGSNMDKDTLVVVATEKSHYSDIFSTLKKNGFNKYIGLF